MISLGHGEVLPWKVRPDSGPYYKRKWGPQPVLGKDTNSEIKGKTTKASPIK